MSRIGNKPVAIPEGVEISVDGQDVKAKGKLGELTLKINDEVSIKLDEVANDDKTEKVVVLEPKSKSRFAQQIWPTMRTLVDNIVIGVSEGYTKKLEIKGVGYRGNLQGKTLVLALGFSHEVRYDVPEGVELKMDGQTNIEITGIDKQLVGQVAASPQRREEEIMAKVKTTASQRRSFRTRNKIRRVNIEQNAKREVRPRLSVFRSGKQIYAQVIDDIKGVTVAAASTVEGDLKEKLKKGGANTEAASEVGKLVAERAKKAGVEKVVFDRGRYIYAKSAKNQNSWSAWLVSTALQKPQKAVVTWHSQL